MVSSRAAEKLGFKVVRKLLEEVLVSPMGLEALKALHPTRSTEKRRKLLMQTDALQRILLRGGSPPLREFIDVRPNLAQARPDYAMLSAEALNEVRKVCFASRRIRTFFSSEDDPDIFQIVRPIILLRELEEHIERVVDDHGKVRESASPELRKIRTKLRHRQEALRAKLRTLLNQAIQKGYAAEPQLTMRAGRMVIPLRSEAKRKMQGFIHDSSSTRQTVYLEPTACLDLGNEVRILEANERSEIERLLREVTSQARECADTIETNLVILGKIDLLHAKAQLSIKLGGIVPRLAEEPILNIRDGINPALALTCRSKEVVPLNLSIGVETQTLVITGPNAGGKTVAMKTCGLMLVMLGCGIPIPVHPDSEFGMFQKILVEIGDEQSIEQDLSTFSARIAGLIQMCDEAAKGVLLLVDEIGTGTDPAEGAALAQAVLEHFTASGALTIVTTHHGTLKAYAHDAEGVENGSMDFNKDTLQPTFIFRQGLPGSSYAFRIASRMGFDSSVLSHAHQILGKPGVTLESLITSYRDRIAELESRLSTSAVKTEEDLDQMPNMTKPVIRRKPGKAAPLPSTRLKVGQEATIDGGSTPCEILSVEGHYALVSAGNMRMKIAMERLTPINTKKVSSKGRVNRSSPKPRIDVRGYRVAEALSEVEKLLNQSAGTSLSTIEIIHGTGTGALRSAIHKYLSSAAVNKTFECHNANPGVTIVKI